MAIHSPPDIMWLSFQKGKRKKKSKNKMEINSEMLFLIIFISLLYHSISLLATLYKCLLISLSLKQNVGANFI